MILMRFSILFFVFIGLFSACKTKEKGDKTSLTSQIATIDDLKKHYQTNLGFEQWLTSDISMSGQFGDYSGTLSGSMRMQRDSAIWLNFKYMGFEVARIWVTKDSVKGIMPIQNQYFAEGLEALKAKGFPADLGQLQSLITGAPVWILGIKAPYNIRLQGDKLRITGQNKTSSELYTFYAEPIQLDSQFIAKPDLGTDIALQYSEYIAVTGAKRPLPTSIDGQAAQSNGGNLSFELVLKNHSTEISKPMRFEIPTHYKRIGL
jgi:Domain of unknown function (DUF4292)